MGLLNSLTMRTDSLPISGTGYEDIPTQGSRLEGFFAAGRTAFRIGNPTHGALVEIATSRRAREEVEANPEFNAAYEAAPRKPRLQIRPGYNPPVKPTYESVLPTYSPGELSQLGYTVPAGIDFGQSGRLSIPRFSILAAARAEQDIDSATVARMPEGALSTATALTGGLAYGIADPTNLIPFGAGINSAKQSVLAGRAAKIAAGAKAGVVSAVPAVVLSDAVAFPQANKWGEDLGFKEAIIDVVAGSTLGAFFGGVGAVARMHSRKAGAAVQEGLVDSVSRLERGEMPDVSPSMARLSNDIDLSVRESALLEARSREFFQADRERATADLRNLTKALEFPRSPEAAGRIITGDAPSVFSALDGVDYKLGFASTADAAFINGKLSRDIGADVRDLPGALAEPLAIYDTSATNKAAVVAMRGEDGVTESLVLVQLEKRDGDKTLAIVDADVLRTPDQLPDAFEMRYFAANRADEMAVQGEAGSALLRDGDAAEGVALNDVELIAFKMTSDMQGAVEANIAATRARGLDAIRAKLDSEDIEVANALSASERMRANDEAMVAAPAREPSPMETDAEVAAMEARLREEGLTAEEMDYLENGNGMDVMGRAEETKLVNEAEASYTASECLIQSFSGFLG